MQGEQVDSRLVKQGLMQACTKQLEGFVPGALLCILSHPLQPSNPQGSGYKSAAVCAVLCCRSAVLSCFGLCRHPKVLALPHMGSATHEVYERMAQVLCHNIRAIREGGDLLHRLC